MRKQEIRHIVDGLGTHAILLEGASILVSGAAGFLGRWVIRTLDMLNATALEEPCTVVAIDAAAALGDVHRRWEYRKELLKPEHIEFQHHDLRAGLPHLTQRFDYVLHMAGVASPYWYRKDPLLTIDIAVQGSRQLLELARRDHARYLFTSSSEVYQTPPAEMIPTPETYIGAVPSMGPRSCYDVSKLMGETLAHTYAEVHGANTVVVRIHNTFGPGMREADHRILPRIASALKGDREFVIYAADPEKMPTRTYCYVTDLVEGLFRALLFGEQSRVYNLGNDAPEVSTLELCRVIEGLQNSRREVFLPKLRYRVEPPPAVYADEPMRRCPDITRARQELGYEPRVTLEDGVLRFLHWARDVYTGDPPP
ncbi:MAG TPA: NAD-dependent epimerase/dehydratase family protein [Terriglobales bacterium]|nr:NAD-dependent epimerase/dehydratase family protein [Terriglobales bacterium]